MQNYIIKLYIKLPVERRIFLKKKITKNYRAFSGIPYLCILLFLLSNSLLYLPTWKYGQTHSLGNAGIVDR